MTDRYTLELTPPASRQLRKLDTQTARKVRAVLETLRDEPRPVGAKTLAGTVAKLRIRVGDYRVIYTVVDERLVVLVLKVGHRREVYRNA